MNVEYKAYCVTLPHALCLYRRQTSSESVTFTYDRWDALLQSLRRIQNTPQRRPLLEPVTVMAVEDRMGGGEAGREGGRGRSRSAPRASMQNSVVAKESSTSAAATHTSSPFNSAGGEVKLTASMLVLRGDGSRAVAHTLDGDAPPPPHPSDSTPTRRDRGAELETIALTSIRRDILRQVTSWATPLQPISLTYSEDRTCNGYQRSVTQIRNGQSCLPALRRVFYHAQRLFEAKAYVHQYSSFGLEEQDFVTAFRRVGQVIRHYEGL